MSLNISIILAHPDPKSFNHAIAAAAIETLWKNCIFSLCGIDEFYRKMFNIVVTSSEEQRTAWLEEVRQIVFYRFPRGA